METDESKQMQRHMVEMALEPIQGMIESGLITPDEAMGLMAEQSSHFSNNEDTPGYRNFRENSELIYANESFFDIGYRMRTGGVYGFKPASHHDVHMLYKLYQHLSGKEYDSPERLKEVMGEVVDGKKILELGCGPGFNIKVLQDLGARVSGVELRENLIAGVPDVDVRWGDAEHLDEIFSDEQFDLIYSRDLFCTAVMDQKKSGKIAAQTYRHTKNSGTGIHQMIYIKMDLPFTLLGMWIANRRLGRNHEEMEEHFWDMPAEERESVLYSNRCSLDPQDLVISGFKVEEYSIEDKELNIVVRK